jgi:hypothetical protein
MPKHDSCPNCGRTGADARPSSWFPVFRCDTCHEYYCEKCGEGECPHCGSEERSIADKIYAK